MDLTRVLPIPTGRISVHDLNSRAFPWKGLLQAEIAKFRSWSESLGVDFVRIPIDPIDFVGYGGPIGFDDRNRAGKVHPELGQPGFGEPPQPPSVVASEGLVPRGVVPRLVGATG